MNEWPSCPVVYELNTWVWLNELSREAGRQITLGTVPQGELERLAGLGFDALWLMGVWERSPEGRRIMLNHTGLQAAYRRALPDYAPEDVVGSPYGVHAYRVDAHLGGDEGLAQFYQRLKQLGLRLILDFVPNHMAVDHSWVTEHPERLLQGNDEDQRRHPESYFTHHAQGRIRIFAHGRDPHFPPWTDTVQIDYRRPETRQAMTGILLELLERCDGVRCDMVMLMNRSVFLRTWGGQFEPPLAEFWPAVTSELKARRKDFLLIAEVYWDMEPELLQMGFDYAYDKRLYDRLHDATAESVFSHLKTDLDYQRRLVRFVENHDERRAMEAFGSHRVRAVALLTLTLPGLRLLHQGQLEGSHLHLPIQLARRHPEPANAELELFYRRLLEALKHPVFHDGGWRLLRPREAWADDFGYRQIIAFYWWLGDAQRLVVVNLAPEPSQCRLPLEAEVLAGRQWRLECLINHDSHLRDGDEMRGKGLYVDLPGYGFHLFAIEPA